MVSGTIYVEWLLVYVQLRFPMDSFFLLILITCMWVVVFFFTCVMPFLSLLCCLFLLFYMMANECNRNTLTVFFYIYLVFSLYFFMLCIILCFKCDAAQYFLGNNNTRIITKLYINAFRTLLFISFSLYVIFILF